jgi:hypothetical protein
MARISAGIFFILSALTKFNVIPPLVDLIPCGVRYATT